MHMQVAAVALVGAAPHMQARGQSLQMDMLRLGSIRIREGITKGKNIMPGIRRFLFM